MLRSSHKVRLSPLWGLLGVLLTLAPAYCRVSQERPLLPFDTWILGTDRHDFAWQVRLLGPRLTFQQRYLEQVRITIPLDKWKEPTQRDLHFLIKVADEQGKWFAPESYTLT